MEDNELQHWGITGMKWGVRRFQNRDGSLTKAGKKRYEKETKALKDEQKILRNKQRTEAKLKKLDALRKDVEDRKKALSDSESQDTIANKKAEIIRSKSAKQLYENADLFETSELQAVYNRLVLERNIKNLSPQEVSKGEQFVDTTTKWTKKASDLLDSGTKLYKSVETVRKLFGDDKSGKATDWRSKDVSKMTDDELAKAVKRATQETMLKNKRGEK